MAAPMLIAVISSTWAAETDVVRDTYLAGAAAAETCAGRKLSMIEELRLEQLIRADSPTPRDGRRFAVQPVQTAGPVTIDCNDADVRDRARLFVETVVPILQAPVMRR
ncbi:MAG: hypothetical protein SFV21_15555 [Rhodospirillaceae bacterium]|nr:hypothetical protein [Rhodospirillaceae bacterium]